MSFRHKFSSKEKVKIVTNCIRLLELLHLKKIISAENPLVDIKYDKSIVYNFNK